MKTIGLVITIVLIHMINIDVEAGQMSFNTRKKPLKKYKPSANRKKPRQANS
jgi:hypothetical protein